MQAIDVSPDYSAPPTTDQCRQLLAAGFDTAIVGGEAPSPQAMRRYINLYALGGLRTGVYGFVRHKTSDPTWSIRRALEAIQGLPVAYFGVDAELDATGVPQSLVRGQIAQSVALVRRERPDVEPLLYTAPWWWNPVMGGSRETFGCRGWMAGYYLVPRPIGVVPPKADARRAYCGGWNETNTVLWQYQSSPPQTCDIHADRNLYIQEPAEEDDMAITMAATGDSPSGYRVYALGGGTPRWIINAAEADELIRLFGAPQPISWKSLLALGA